MGMDLQTVVPGNAVRTLNEVALIRDLLTRFARVRSSNRSRAPPKDALPKDGRRSRTMRAPSRLRYREWLGHIARAVLR